MKLGLVVSVIAFLWVVADHSQVQVLQSKLSAKMTEFLSEIGLSWPLTLLGVDKAVRGRPLTPTESACLKIGLQSSNVKARRFVHHCMDICKQSGWPFSYIITLLISVDTMIEPFELEGVKCYAPSGF